MTLQHFNTLPQQQQHKRLLSSGRYIADYKTESTDALLFQLNNFFVEVCFSCEGDDVLYTRQYENASKLGAYWQHINFSGAVA